MTELVFMYHPKARGQPQRRELGNQVNVCHQDLVNSILVKLFGHPALIIHGDTLMLDRWKWLQSRLPITRNGESLVDIGCGSGAFTIGAALRGYHSLGLSWDQRNQSVASHRAHICNAGNALFDVLDVRKLASREDLYSSFDVAISFENIEHIIDDRKLMIDMAACLKPGGRLLLTTPYLLNQPISNDDMGPFTLVENGDHVRRGYSKAMLNELCLVAGLVPERYSHVSGFFSQKLTSLSRILSRLHPLLGWAIILPLRWLPSLVDQMIYRFTKYPYFSICLEAYKPKYDLKSRCE
jgi:2-polyprenyl-3-methyl-5-hydroxy-6-metoxy-1,4-benzoquinol methylase